MCQLRHLGPGPGCSDPPPLSRGGAKILFRKALLPSTPGPPTWAQLTAAQVDTATSGAAPTAEATPRWTPGGPLPSEKHASHPLGPAPAPALPDRHTRTGTGTSGSRGGVWGTGAGWLGGGHPAIQPDLLRPPQSVLHRLQDGVKGPLTSMGLGNWASLMGLPESWGPRPAVTIHTRRLPPRVTRLAHTPVPLKTGDLPREAAPPCPPPSLPPRLCHPIGSPERCTELLLREHSLRAPETEHLVAEGGVAMGTGHGIGHGDWPPGGAGRGTTFSFILGGWGPHCRSRSRSLARRYGKEGRSVAAPGRPGPAVATLSPQGSGSDSGLRLTQPGEATCPRGHQPLATWPPAAP